MTQTEDSHRKAPPDDTPGNGATKSGQTGQSCAAKELAERLIQFQKMHAVGMLAGGIAHDFNNLLTAINGYSELALSRLGAGDALRPTVEEIKRAGERAAILTQQWLAFSRKRVLQPQVLDLNAVAAGVGGMLRRLMGDETELIMRLAPDLARTKADPGRIEQVIINLAVNARDAMPSGGTLTIESANVETGRDPARTLPGMEPGPCVMLSISDTGAGMSPEVQAHVFEPFFTTKEVGKGTGLGLFTVYCIVRQSDGHICFTSAPGQGTVFRIYLPRAE